MLKHVGVSLSCYTGFQVHCPIQTSTRALNHKNMMAQKHLAIMYQQWLWLGLLAQGMYDYSFYMETEWHYPFYMVREWHCPFYMERGWHYPFQTKKKWQCSFQMENEWYCPFHMEGEWHYPFHTQYFALRLSYSLRLSTAPLPFLYLFLCCIQLSSSS